MPSHSDAPELPPLIGTSPAFLELLEDVSRLAALDRPMLIVGERGTGKELIAARLAGLSPRWDRPLVTVNCAALPDSLLESDLFGHEAGAFTGAVRRRAGRFERADGGTLFLDEIATAGLAVQEKILRVIEYGEYERLGGTGTLRCDVRILAAANVDLPTEADAGRFRLDLLDRLAFDVVTVPPLRARQGDIRLLATTFGRAMASEIGWDAFPGFSKATMTAFENHDWPGNVRELRNTAERAVAAWPDPEAPVGAAVLDPFDSPWRPRTLIKPSESSQAPASAASVTEPVSYPYDLDAKVMEQERALLDAALEAHRFNQTETAKSLALSYPQLRARMKKHGML